MLLALFLKDVELSIENVNPKPVSHYSNLNFPFPWNWLTCRKCLLILVSQCGKHHPNRNYEFSMDSVLRCMSSPTPLPFFILGWILPPFLHPLVLVLFSGAAWSKFVRRQLSYLPQSRKSRSLNVSRCSAFYMK